MPSSSRLLLRRTAALSSNRIERPSGRFVSFFVRTTTARRISPRRTLFDASKFDDEEDGPDEFWGIGRARLITHTISSPVQFKSYQHHSFKSLLSFKSSPIRACPCRPLNLRTLMHSAISPPELSMIICLERQTNSIQRCITSIPALSN